MYDATTSDKGAVLRQWLWWMGLVDECESRCEAMDFARLAIGVDR